MYVNGLNYVYNHRGRVPISNQLIWFLYDKLPNCKSIYDTAITNDTYDLSDLLRDIRKLYNKSYWYGFPRYIRMSVSRANTLFEKKKLPFVIENISSNKLINKKYRLKYIGEFANEVKFDSHYEIISILDQIYVCFDLAHKYSPISEKNMQKLIKCINELIDMNDSIKECFNFANFNTVSSINQMLKNIGFPFTVQFVKDIKGRPFYLFKKIDDSSIFH